ncbi:beta-ketoacyl synthase N-terminal-like domain-containing protein, partial [Flavivirga jejuensis]
TPLDTHNGIETLYSAWKTQTSQITVLQGNQKKIVKLLKGSLISKVEHKTTPLIQDKVNLELLKEKTLNKTITLFSKTIKLNANRIDPNDPFEMYGIDSMLISKLNYHLEKVFGETPKTLLFEYQTIISLTEYFLSEYPKKCIEWTQLKSIDKPIDHNVFKNDFPKLISFAKNKRLHKLKNTKPIENSINNEKIAIIGLSGKYPKANNLTEYWKNLSNGKDCISCIPKDRWSMENFFIKDSQEASTKGKSYSKWGGFLDGFANFDPLFFNISPKEAYDMDPQERLFIETCWEVIENAGYTRISIEEKFNSNIGVFVGVTKTGYNLYGPDLWKNDVNSLPHTSFGSIANRVSYLLNLKGPSIPIDTMCSSSLTAIHESCQHLLRGECEMAIAGGVNLYLHPSSYVALSSKHMLSIDGKCKSFGKGGNGFVPGEGVGSVLLKPLSKAIEDNDKIYGVIKGTSINHGGKTNGYTVPNPKSQGDLIYRVMDKASVNARSISYIEAHGTGTDLGDPIEVRGLNSAFRKDTQDKQFCFLGSAKSNIGHLEAAAGIAGLTKVLLQMENKKIVPSLHSSELNGNINFKESPFMVPQKLINWERPLVRTDGELKELLRTAGISSFGAGGSNAHVIIEEYDSSTRVSNIEVTTDSPGIFVLSAK